MRLSKCAHWRKRLLLARTIHVFLECMAQPMDDICLILGITMETVRSEHSFVEDDSQHSGVCQWHLSLNVSPIHSVAAGNTDWAKCVVQSWTSDVRLLNRFTFPWTASCESDISWFKKSDLSGIWDCRQIFAILYIHVRVCVCVCGYTFALSRYLCYFVY